MVSIVISIASSIISGMVLFFLQRYFKKNIMKMKNENINDIKRCFIDKSINAIGDLTLANSIALRDGKTNGELKKALSEYDKVNKEMIDFLIENSVDQGE